MLTKKIKFKQKTSVRRSHCVYLCFLFVILTLAFFSTSAFARDTYSFTGKAYKNSELVYIEKHRVEFKKNKRQKTHTNYLSPKGEKIASFASDYTMHPYVPVYTFIDHRFEIKNGIYAEGKTLKKYRKDGKGIQTKAFRYKPDMIAGQGLNYFIEDHLDEFIKNPDKEYHVNFLIPQRLSSFRFRIRRVENKTKKENILSINIESDNWFFRLFVPYIETEYDIDKKRLVYYNGPSNLDDKEGSAQNVQIVYEYE